MASRGGGANRTAGGPGPRPPGFGARRRTAAAQIRCHCRSCRRGSPAENRHGGAPRGVPVAPGHGGRASHARRKRRVRLSALHPPLVRGAMGLLLPGLPPRLRRPLHRSLGQGRGEQDRQTRAHKRAAGTKKTALFDIVSLRPWPTVRFARRDFARVVRGPLSCPGRAQRDPGPRSFTAKSMDIETPVGSPRGPGSRSARAKGARYTRPGHEITAQSRAPASPCRSPARHGRSNGSPRNRRRHRRDSRSR